MKIIGLVVLILILLGCVFGAVNYYTAEQKARKDLERERYLRITAEEALDAANIKIESLNVELGRVESKATNLEKQLDQKKIVINDLKSRLDKANEIKDSIEKKVAELESMVGVSK